MGGSMCGESTDTRPGVIAGKNKDKIQIFGFILNADSRALVLFCQIANLDFDYSEVDMLKGEH